MKHMILCNDTRSVLAICNSDWELEAFVEELEVGDVEFTIYEQGKDGQWDVAEFYCTHTQTVVNAHGAYEERCENMSDLPNGCVAHRDVF